MFTRRNPPAESECFRQRYCCKSCSVNRSPALPIFPDSGKISLKPLENPGFPGIFPVRAVEKPVDNVENLC